MSFLLRDTLFAYAQVRHVSSRALARSSVVAPADAATTVSVPPLKVKASEVVGYVQAA